MASNAFVATDHNLAVTLCLGEQNKEIRVFKDVLDLRAGKEVLHILR